MHPGDVKDKVDEKRQNFEENPSEFLKQYWGVSAALTIFVLALYLRYLPEQGMQFFQALDPYWIFRQSQHFAYSGNIPAVDFMRYFPYNAPFQHFNNGDIVIPAVVYWLGPALVFGSYLEWAQFYPALMGALGVLMTYFLGKEIYDKYAGVSAAFFLATIPGVLHRTSAGFFEKEPVGSFFMIVSLYFFTRAWKRRERASGIISGLALGLFTVSWGGSKILWLLYPLVVGIMMLLNEDIEELLIAYTPTVLVAGGLASIFNYSKFSFTGTLFLANLAGLAFLWSRYIVEEFELLDSKYIPYYTPVVSVVGLVLVLLSPLYSNFIASKMMSIIGVVTQSTGGVIAGTVAENTPASLGQLVGQLGASSSAQIANYLTGPLSGLRPLAGVLGGLANLVGGWTLALVGVVISGSYVSGMILRKFGYLEKQIENKKFQLIMVSVLFVWAMTIATMFNAGAGAKMIAVGPAVLVMLGSIGVSRGLKSETKIDIEFNWYQMLPFVWAVASILGAVAKSRLIFLSAFPTAFMAGYAFSKAWKRLKEMETEKVTQIGIGAGVLVADIFLIILLTALTPLGFILNTAAVLALNGVVYYAAVEKELDKELEEIDLKKTVLVGLIAITLLTNFSAGFVNANSLGGSPSNLWMENLDYMNEETPEGSVILSWWDYGYWFESIGRRAAIADGGNSGYYSDNWKINYPLAEFLTSDDPGNWTSWLNKHSVDYVVLDQTMIGKYSAVSQIANKDNSQYNRMFQCAGSGCLSTSRDIRRSISRDSENNTLVQFSLGNIGVYLPVEVNNRSVSISEDTAPTVEAGRRGKVDCVLTPENGRINYDVEPTQLPGNFFGTGNEPQEACVAINPYNNLERAFGTAGTAQATQAQAILVPKEISRSTLVRLYLMDGHGMENFEKVEEGSAFGYVKMWEYNQSEE